MYIYYIYKKEKKSRLFLLGYFLFFRLIDILLFTWNIVLYTLVTQNFFEESSESKKALLIYFWGRPSSVELTYIGSLLLL
jgi:hypothetical protein